MAEGNGLGCQSRPGIEKPRRSRVRGSEPEKDGQECQLRVVIPNVSPRPGSSSRSSTAAPEGVRTNDSGVGEGRGSRILSPRNPVYIGCTSETPSMGPEPDLADSEVKRPPDLSFRHLSTPPPPPDYLDVCDSSCRCSVDGSQVSADEDSSASTWYAELNVSGQSESDKDSLSHLEQADLHDNDDHGGESFGAGGFECVDVELENGEEAGRGAGPKTVPKRQIQLRRCSTEESLAAAGGGLGTLAPSQCHGHPKAMLYRQYSTPVTIQGRLLGACLNSPPGNRKQRLQKSLSLDETSSRTKMASSLIKNVLSKKMEVELKIQQQKPEEGAFSQSCPITETPKTETGNEKHRGQRWSRSWSQEGPPGQAELDPQGGSVHQNVSAKTHSSRAESDSRGARCSGDSAKTGAGKAASTWARAVSGAEGKCQALAGNDKQQSTGCRFPPKPAEIALAPRAREETRGSGDCLPKNLEIRLVADTVPEAGVMLRGAGEVGNKEDGEKGQTVAPLHRVRDMRKLVKSTYSSSFNVSAASGERHPGKTMQVPLHGWGQTLPDGARVTGSLCTTSNSCVIKGKAPVMSRDETIAVPRVPKITREVRVPPNVQKPLAKVTSAKKPAVNAGYNPQLTTTPGYLPTPPMSSYKEQPGELTGVNMVSTYKQQQGAAPSSRSCHPTANATPSYKIPKRDVTSCPSEGVPIGGMREKFGLPPTRSQDPPTALPNPGHLTYQTASIHTKNPKPMQATGPTPLLLPRPKDTMHPQARNGHGTLQISFLDPSALTRGEPERGRSRSPHKLPPEAQPAYPCGPPAFAPELGSQSGKAPYLPGGGGLVLGQNQRRLLLDPETGTCFYVEMPAQPRRKVLFDPESGQYMEVLVPPQPLYPSSINPCPYPYLPAPSVYAPQYLPYSVLSMPQGP